MLMVGAVGFENTVKRSFNNIQGTAGTVRHWKALENKLTDRKWIAGFYPATRSLL
jgi:hypothetical protein